MNKELAVRLLSNFRVLGRSPRMDYFMPVDYDNKIWWSATNGSEILMIRADKIEFEKDNGFEFPPDNVVNIARALPEFIKVVGTLDLVDFKETYLNVPLVEVPVMIECDACEGKGTFGHYGEEYDCKTCDETGKVSANRKEKVKSPDYLFHYNNQYFELKHIHNTADTIINRINPKEVKILEAKICLFLALDDIALIYLAPCNDKDEIEDFNKRKILEIKIK